METNFISANRLWIYTTDPDTTVHNSSEIYADFGEYFFNTSNNSLFICSQGGTDQIWVKIAYNAQIAAAISAILQPNWTQTTISAQDYIKNKPLARSQSSATRSLNTAFQISTTRDSLVSYGVDIATSITLVTGQSGTVFLEIASDSGFTLNVQQLGQFTNSNTGTLTIGLALNQIGTACLTGYIPTSYYVRLRTANNTGTPTFTYKVGQEVLL